MRLYYGMTGMLFGITSTCKPEKNWSNNHGAVGSRMGNTESSQLENSGDDLVSGVLRCLLSRRTPFTEKQQLELVQTKWYSDWNAHCGAPNDKSCPVKVGECWSMGVLVCRRECDAKLLMRGNRGKFKRCIYKELKAYEENYEGIVEEECSVLVDSKNNQF